MGSDQIHAFSINGLNMSSAAHMEPGNSSYALFPNNTYQFRAVTSQSLFMTRLIVQTYLVPFVVACGIVGNFFNIIVLINPKMRTSTNIYLMSLACCDSLYLLFTLTLSFLHCSNTALPEAAFRYIPFARVFSDLFGNTAVWLTVCFTLERYIAVRLPMKGKAWCTVKKAKIAIFIVFLLCFVNTFPEFFETRIGRIHANDSTTRWHFECIYTDFAKTVSYQFGYYWWYVAIFTFMPLVLLLVFNLLLIRSVCEANRKRQMLSQTRVIGETTKQTKEQQHVTMMLISVVLIFLICQTPQAILLLFSSYAQSYHIDDYIKIAGNICNLLVQINASANFLLYSYFSSKFRRTFRRVVCRCKISQNNSLQTFAINFQLKPSSSTRTTLTSSYRLRRCDIGSGKYEHCRGDNMTKL